MTIFISYRHREAKLAAIAIEKALKVEVPAGCVFRDEVEVRPGSQLDIELDRAASSCRAMIILIGPDWLTAKDDKTGKPRLLNAADRVRKEIRLALTNGAKILPVYLDDTKEIESDALPEDIRPIAEAAWARLSTHARTTTHDIETVVAVAIELSGLQRSQNHAPTIRRAEAELDFDAEFSKSFVRFAEPQDIDAVYAIAESFFTEDIILKKSEVARWMMPGLRIMRVAIRRSVFTGTEAICGYYSILPLSRSTYERLCNEEIQERDLRREDFLDWRHPDLHAIYICAWARIEQAAKLHKDLARNILALCQQSQSIAWVSAWPIRGPSKEIARKIGMASIRPCVPGKTFMHQIAATDFVAHMTGTRLGNELCSNDFNEVFG